MDNGKGGKEFMKTGTYKLTFNTNVVPREMSVQYVKCKVNVYYDNPMFCDIATQKPNIAQVIAEGKTSEIDNPQTRGIDRKQKSLR